MPRKSRRLSQNARLMREILLRLREYDLDEVRLLCEKYKKKKAASAPPPPPRRRRNISSEGQ